jgi:hypothetical protein
LVRWPGQIPAGTKVPQICGAIDLLPTLAELCGVKVGNDKPLDGRSIATLLHGESSSWTDRQIFSHWNGKVSVRTQQFRLDDAGKLYDMVADGGQTTDVAAEHRDVAKELKAAVKQWRSDVLSELDVKAERPFPVGYREFPLTHLPARDGEPHGCVRRSGKAPNCSFFTHWTDLDGSMTWDVDVATAGRYEATVYYACAPQNVGCVVELGLGDAKLTSKITAAHDPPLRGMEHDRHDRGAESYVKDFKPLSLGEINLPKGHGTLTLKALEKPGPEVIEVRLISLTLLP